MKFSTAILGGLLVALLACPRPSNSPPDAGGGPNLDSGTPDGGTDAGAFPCACAAGDICIGGTCSPPQRTGCACSGWQVCTASGECVAPPAQSTYSVGVCYHDIGLWQLDSNGNVVPSSEQIFIPLYNQPGVRAKVRAQLQSLASKNVEIVKTILWYGNAHTSLDNIAVAFPPTSQQLQNLHDYAVDVSTTLRPDGTPMQLYLSAGYLDAADVSIGDPNQDKVSWTCESTADYSQRMQQTLSGVFGAVGNVFRADGLPVATLAYFFSEVQVCASDDDADPNCAGAGQRCGSGLCDPCGISPGPTTANHNQQWLLKTFYPSFVEQARDAGIIPTVYFNGSVPEWAVVGTNGWSDPYAGTVPAFSVLTHHLSMSNVFHSLWWWQAHSLPLPERLEIDFFPDTFSTGTNTPNHAAPNYTTPATWLDRTFDDLEAVMPTFYGSQPLRYGVPETTYYQDPMRRAEIGKAFAAERLWRGNNPEFVAPWAGLPQPEETTTDTVENLDFTAFTTDGIVFPFVTFFSNLGFETSSDGGLPDEWQTLSPAATLTNGAWHGGGSFPDVFDGQADLRFDVARCDAGCASVESDPISVGPAQVLVFSLEQKNGYRFDDTVSPNPAPSSPGYSGMLFSVVPSSGPTLLEFGTMNNSFNNAVGANPPQWSRFVGIVPVTEQTSVRLRIGMQNVPLGTVMDVDHLR